MIECLERHGKGFQVWLSAARGLTRAQRREALAVLSGRSEGEASKAAIELGVDEARRCPHCASEGAVSRGMARGLRRYQCKGCGRTFNALSGTPLSGLPNAGCRSGRRWRRGNVNFWITPDDANLDAESGGLTIWDHEAPADWDFEAYNNDIEASRRFITETGAKPIFISYRENRVAIFNSDLLHETQPVRFRPGYESRRINITMLYGRRQDAG